MPIAHHVGSKQEPKLKLVIKYTIIFVYTTHIGSYNVYVIYKSHMHTHTHHMHTHKLPQ